MRALQEKLEKMQRRLKTFMNFLNDDSKAISHPSYAQELGSDWLSIQKYLNDVTVAFEFECYLDVGYGPLEASNYSSSDDLSITDLSEIDSYKLTFLKENFRVHANEKAWDRLEEAYFEKISDLAYEKRTKLIDDARIEHEEAQEKLPEDERTEFNEEDHLDEYDIESIEEDIQSEFTLKDFLGVSFENMLEVVEKFRFEHPIFGFWSSDSNCIHDTEESYNYDVYGGGDSEDEKRTHRDECYETIRDRLEEVFDTKLIRVSSEWHGISTEFKRSNPDHWFVEYDSSLDKYNDTYQKVPVEIISPRIPAKNFIEVLSKFKKNVYEHFDGETGKQGVGCHVNISFSEQLIINPVKLIMMADAHRWATKFNRQFESFAKSQQQEFKQIIERATLHSLPLSEIEKKLNAAIKLEKMMDINFLKTNVIEFRFPGNEYLEKYYDALVETVQWLLYAMVVATHENFHRQEYLYRLGKLLNRSTKDNKGLLTNLVFAYIRFINSNNYTIAKYFNLKDTITFCLELKNISFTTEMIRKINDEISDKDLVKNAKAVSSTTTLDRIITQTFSKDSEPSKLLFLAKVQELKTKIPMEFKTKLEFDNDEAAVNAFELYKKAARLFSILKLPIINVKI